MDWENCEPSKPGKKPKRSSLSDSILKLWGSIGGVLSSSAIGAELAGEMRIQGWNFWKDIHDGTIYSSSDPSTWIKKYLSRVHEALLSKINKTATTFAPTPSAPDVPFNAVGRMTSMATWPLRPLKTPEFLTFSSALLGAAIFGRLWGTWGVSGSFFGFWVSILGAYGLIPARGWFFRKGTPASSRFS